jgi:hypothetical protein
VVDHDPLLKADSEMCLRIARRLSVRGGHGQLTSHDVADSPQRTAGAPRSTKFVDLSTVSEDDWRMALEHTTIESYELQLHEARQIESLLLPLEDRLAGQLPDGSRFELMVGYGAVFDRDLEADAVLTSVEAWVRAVAPTLENRSGLTTPHHFARAEPPEVAVAVALYRWPSDAPALARRLRIRRSQAADRDAQFERRVRRLRRALDEKLVSSSVTETTRRCWY